MAKKKIKVSDILGDNYYVYELTSSNYTPALNGTITITCTMKDVYGTAASGKSITLYQNGTSKGAQTTNSSGVATWSITCSSAGLQKFNIKDTSIEVFVDNKSNTDHTHNTTEIRDSSAYNRIGSGVNDTQAKINDSIDYALTNLDDNILYTKRDLIGFDKFQVKNFINPNNWENSGCTYSDGVLTFSGSNSFTATFPADFELSFDYIIDDGLIWDNTIDFDIFGRETSYTVVEDDINDGYAIINVSFKSENNMGIITSEITGDAWHIDDVGSLNPYTIRAITPVGNSTKIANIRYKANDIISLNDNKEDTSNKVTSLSSLSTDTQYPSAKAVYDAVNNNGFITNSQIINNDNFCDYKTLIPLVDEGDSISDVSFEDYDFDIVFTINPNIEENDCQGSVEIGDPASGGVYIQYSNQEIQIQTQSGDKFNIALNMNSENIVKIKQDKTTNDLIITVNDYEVVSTDNSEITKNIMMITSSVGTISNFGVKTCTRIITEATINAPTNKNFITTSFTPSKLTYYTVEMGAVNNHNSFTVNDAEYVTFDFGCQNNEYYEFDITTSRGNLNIYGPKFRKKYCELYRDDTYTIKITHDELLIVKGTTVDGTTVVDISNSNGILNFSTSVVCQFDFSNKKWYHETTFFDKIYPIGSVHITTNSVNPSNYFDGEWERIQDRFLLASGTTYANGSTGGSATVTLTSAQSGVPAHKHTYAHTDTTYKLNTTNRKPGTSTAVAYGTSITGTANNTTKTSNDNTTANASQAHENMPPYLTVYMWERIA